MGRLVWNCAESAYKFWGKCNYKEVRKTGLSMTLWTTLRHSLRSSLLHKLMLPILGGVLAFSLNTAGVADEPPSQSVEDVSDVQLSSGSPQVGNTVSCQTDKVLLEDGFENGRREDLYQYQTSVDHGIDYVSNPQGPGKVLRFELRKGDPIRAGSARSEIRIKRLGEQFGVVYNYKFRTFSPSNSTSGEIVAQWHEPESTGYGPPFALFQINGGYEISMNENGTKRVRRPLYVPIKPGEWMDWTFQIEWGMNGDGSFKIFSNGKQVFEYNGTNSLQSSPSYFKLGIYKPNWKSAAGQPWLANGENVVMYYDDLIITESCPIPNDLTNDLHPQKELANLPGIALKTPA